MLTANLMIEAWRRELRVDALRMLDDHNAPVQVEEIDGRSREFICPLFEWEIDGKKWRGAVPVSVEIVEYDSPAVLRAIFPLLAQRGLRENSLGTLKNLAAMVEQSRTQKPTT